ncbi:MAG: hypothetical protein E7403_07960 [Ruminococcaceae bacterium]|nr:hypothetical protein [Oscillospiraceae bacterium]
MMKACEIIDKLFALAEERDYSKSCDKCIAGDENKEVKKIAVAMHATPNLLKEVKEWGAELLIIHEPVTYGIGSDPDDKVVAEKKKLLAESGLAIYRYHDHTHCTVPDIIAAGEFKQFGLKGRLETTDIFDLVRFHLEEPITARELAKLIEETTGIKHVRISGATDIPATKVSSVFGASKRVMDELKNEDSQIVLAGEVTEWSFCEYARDAAQMGYNKSLLILGHVGSERDGMRYTAEILSDMFPELCVAYFDCGEVYTYTDC